MNGTYGIKSCQFTEKEINDFQLKIQNTIPLFFVFCVIYRLEVFSNNNKKKNKKGTLWVSGKYIKKNWRAGGLEATASAPSCTIVTDGNC